MIMVAVILAVIGAGIFAVGSIKGWFSDKESSLAAAEDVTGIVTVERGGASFELKDGDVLQAGDKIKTNEKAGIVINSGGNTYELAESSSAELDAEDKKVLSMELAEGEVFVVLDKGESFGRLVVQDTSVTAGGTVFSVNAQTGSMGVNVFEGKVKAVKGDNNAEAEAGQTLSAVGSEMTVASLDARFLNRFNIDKAIAAGKTHDLCFSEEELNKVIEEREAEAAEPEEETSEENQTDNKPDKDSSQGSKTPASSDNTGDKEQGNKGDGGSKDPGSSGSSSGSEPEYDYSCTIEIRCDTILNNMDNLDPSKKGYVPSNGTILKRTTVGFNNGETVFDVLKRICSSKGIQMEASWTLAYGSSYVEGINNLYELDCGPQSGWMYKVNGWFPNYGASSYKLKDGDVIVWLYTCEGLGADVGGSVNW